MRELDGANIDTKNFSIFQIKILAKMERSLISFLWRGVLECPISSSGVEVLSALKFWLC